MRKLLDKIIHANGGSNWWKLDLFLKYTLKALPKEIKILKNPPKEEDNYNCFIYAMGLYSNKTIKKNAKDLFIALFFKRFLKMVY